MVNMDAKYQMNAITAKTMATFLFLSLLEVS